MIKTLAHTAIYTVTSIRGDERVIMQPMWTGNPAKPTTGWYKILSATKIEFPKRRRRERFLVRYTVMEETTL